MKWKYEKLNENYKTQYCPMNDADGEITGRHIINLPAWFDENPEERMRLGWIKHLYYEKDEDIQKEYPYNPQSQYLVRSIEQIDEYTVKDVYHVMDKTEEIILLEEILETLNGYIPVGLMVTDANGGILL